MILSDSSSLKVCTNPGWFEKIENSKLLCDFSSEKTENSERFEIPKKSEDLVRPKNSPPPPQKTGILLSLFSEIRT